MVALWSSAGGRRWAPSKEVLERYAQAFSGDDATRQAVEAARELGSLSRTPLAQASKAKFMSSSRDQLYIYKAMLLAETVSKRITRTNPQPATGNTVTIRPDVVDAAQTLLDMLWQSDNDQARSKAVCTLDDMAAQHGLERKPTEEPEHNQALVEWAKRVRSEAAARLADGGYHQFGSWTRPNKAHMVQERTDKDVISAAANRIGGGPMDAIVAKDEDGDEFLIADCNGFAKHVETVQQNLSGTTNWFPLIMHKVLFDTTVQPSTLMPQCGHTSHPRTTSPTE